MLALCQPARHGSHNKHCGLRRQGERTGSAQEPAHRNTAGGTSGTGGTGRTCAAGRFCRRRAMVCGPGCTSSLQRDSEVKLRNLLHSHKSPPVNLTSCHQINAEQYPLKLRHRQGKVSMTTHRRSHLEHLVFTYN